MLHLAQLPWWYYLRSEGLRALILVTVCHRESLPMQAAEEKRQHMEDEQRHAWETLQGAGPKAVVGSPALIPCMQ